MKKGTIKYVAIFLTASIFLIINCKGPKRTEFENKPIPEVKIGNQIWMAENLNISTFRNGDTIKEVQIDSAWLDAYYQKNQAAMCYYENDTTNAREYGALYNWWAVHDPRGLAPKGWHIPSDEEWEILTTFLGGDSIAGNKLKSIIGWGNELKGLGIVDNGNGNNASAFNGLPGGSRMGAGYFGKKFFGVWWSSRESRPGTAKPFLLSFDAKDGILGHDMKGFGCSVRCIKD